VGVLDQGVETVEAHPLPPSVGSLTDGTSPAPPPRESPAVSRQHPHLPTEHWRQSNREQAQRRRGRSRSPHRHRYHHRRLCLRGSRGSSTHHRHRPPGNPRRGAEESKLTVVKWIHPSVSDHQVLESLRDSGLLTPAGTQVLPRCAWPGPRPWLQQTPGRGSSLRYQSRCPQRKSKAQHQFCYLLVTVPPNCTGTGSCGQSQAPHALTVWGGGTSRSLAPPSTL